MVYISICHKLSSILLPFARIWRGGGAGGALTRKEPLGLLLLLLAGDQEGDIVGDDRVIGGEQDVVVDREGRHISLQKCLQRWSF